MVGEPKALTLDEILGQPELIVFDCEYTAWEGSVECGWNRPGEICEIVELGAVKLDCRRDLVEIDHCQFLVRPTVNPVLSQYFVSLTGISQDDVDVHGLAFPEAARRFASFCEGCNGYLAANGRDDESFLANCSLNHLAPTIHDERFVDLTPLLADALGCGEHELISNTLPARLGLTPVGRPHRALDDARNIAIALRQSLAPTPQTSLSQ